MSPRTLVLGLALITAAAARGAGAEPHTDLYGDLLPEGAVLRLGTTRLRSTASLMRFTPDGRTLITCERGRVIQYREVETGEPRQCSVMPRPFWYPEDLTSDGSLYLGGTGGGLAVWEVASGRRLFQLENFLGVKAAFSHDGATLAAVGPDQKASLWDVRSGKARPFDAKTYMAWRLLFSPDDLRIVVTTTDFLACLDAATGHELWRLDGTTIQTAWSPDGRTLAACLAPPAPVKDAKKEEKPFATVRFLNGADGKPAGVDPLALPGVLRGLRYSPAGDVLACRTETNIILCDLKTGKERRRLLLYPAVTNGEAPFEFAPDGKTLTALAGGKLRRWDLASGKDLYPDVSGRGPDGSVQAVAWSPDGRRIVTAGWGLASAPRLWDAATGKLIGKLPAPDEPQWWAEWLKFAPDGKRLYGATALGKVRCWDTAAMKEVWSADPLKRERQDSYFSLSSFGLTSDGKRLLLIRQLQNGSGSAETCVLDSDGGSYKQATPAHSSNGGGEAFSPDGRRRVSREGEWSDVQTDAAIRILGAKDKVGSLLGWEPGAFSPDGALYAAPLMGWDAGGAPLPVCRGVQVWETATGGAVVCLPETEFGTLQFAPDGRTLAVVGGDDIRLWDVPTGEEVYRRPVVNRLLGEVPAVAFSPDGRRLATACVDGCVLIWEVKSARRPAVSEEPTITERESLWKDLADDDAAIAYAAVRRLADHPAGAVALLGPKVRPAAGLPAETTRRLLTDLNADEFDTREAAARQLGEQIETAEWVLRDALQGDLTAEQRTRIMDLLKAASVTPAPETLRSLRAVQALAWAGGPAARDILEKLAECATDAPLTRAARAALGL